MDPMIPSLDTPSMQAYLVTQLVPVYRRAAGMNDAAIAELAKVRGGGACVWQAGSAAPARRAPPGLRCRLVERVSGVPFPSFACAVRMCPCAVA